eukprot:gene14324-19215_t
MMNLYGKTFLGPSPSWNSHEMMVHSKHLVQSYNQLTGKHLIYSNESSQSLDNLAKSLYNLPNIVVVSHGIQTDMPNGPILNYGNKCALERWEATWEQLTAMPSRFTAEPMERDARAAFMNQVTLNGIVNDYNGIRIGLNGRRFRIMNATVWNIVIENQLLGQAATFSKWEYLS